jgi:hypothetical protein
VQDLSNIQHQLTQEGLFDAFKKQLAKDFEQSNFSTEFVKSLSPDFQSIVGKIAYELQRSEKQSDNHLAQLLYRIDISEGQLKKYLLEQNEENPLHVIAQLVVKRILQKVVIRMLYKRRDGSESSN